MSVRESLQSALERANAERIQASERVQEYNDQLTLIVAKVNNTRGALPYLNELREKAERSYQQFREYRDAATSNVRASLEPELERLAQECHTAVQNVQSVESAARESKGQITDLEKERDKAHDKLVAVTARWEQIKKQLESSVVDSF